MKIDRSVLLQKIQARRREADNDIDHYTEEIEYATRLKEDLQAVETYLQLHPDIDLNTEASFRPTQQLTLKELGKEDLIKKQKQVSENLEIDGINILDLLD